MFQEGEPTPQENPIEYKEKDVVVKSTIQKKSWWERVFGSKETPTENETPSGGVKVYTPEEVKEKNRIEEANRFRDEKQLRESIVTPPKPKPIKPEKEAVEVEETPV